MRRPKRIYLNPFFRLCRTRSNENHVFVVGAPRSGTTLVSNVISNHSNFCSLNAETNLFGWMNCFIMFEGLAGRHSSEFHQFRRKFNDVVQLMDGLALETKERCKRSRFVEKTPQHVFHLPFILKHFPNAMVVNVIRDPRDGYVSSKANAHVTQSSPAAYAKYWKRSVNARLREGDHKSIVDINYETIVNSPDQEFKNLMSKIGEEFEPSQISTHLMGKHPLAGKKAFNLLGKKISNKSVGRWRKELSCKEIVVIERIAGEYMGQICQGTTQ